MINCKNLGKALKRDGKPAYWFKTEKYDYITDGYFIAKTGKRLELEKGISNAVIGMFKGIPEIGQGLQINRGEYKSAQIEDSQKKSFIEMIDNVPSAKIIPTGLMTKRTSIEGKQFEDVIFESTEGYTFVDRMYADMINEIPDTGMIELYGSKPTHPIYAVGDDEVVMLFPVRYQKTDIPKYLKVLENDR